MPSSDSPSIFPLSLHDALPIYLLSLINDVLDLSKVEAGQVELEVAAFSLRDALERGVVMVRERAIRDGVELAFSANHEVDVVEGRSEEHTSELQSLRHLVCRLLTPPRSSLFPYTTLFRSICSR